MDVHDEDAASDPSLESGTEAAADLGDAAKSKGDTDFTETNPNI